jgi:two-component system invasion response regulator UvrY
MAPAVYIVDDHPLIRRSIAEHLRDNGVCVVGDAATASHALNHVAPSEANVVLADVSMRSGMNGIEMIRRLKKAHPALRVIMVSSHDFTSTVQQALKAGADGYVAKTSVLDELVDAIEVVLMGKQYLCTIAQRRIDEV